MEILPDLSICVIARQGGETITGFLHVLFDAPGYVDLQVIVLVADNALADQLGQEFAEALVFAEEDLAVADAVLYNRALRFATGRYLALVNEGVVCTPGALERLLDFMEDVPDVGVVGPRLVLPSGLVAGSVRRFLSLPAFLLLDCLSLQKGWLVKSLWRRHFLTDWDRASSREVQWLSDLFLLFRREVLDDIGWLDESYGERYAGLDYCHRARQAAWHNHFLHDPEMVMSIAPAEASEVGWQTMVDGLRFLGKKWWRSWV